MPSSKDRQRIEIPVYLYEQLAQIAQTEDRTITSVLNQLLFQALQGYQPTWIPSKHLSRFNGHAQHVLSLARVDAGGFFVGERVPVTVGVEINWSRVVRRGPDAVVAWFGYPAAMHIARVRP